MATRDGQDGRTTTGAAEPGGVLRLELTGQVWHWRGPAPHHFVTLPAACAEQVRELATAVSYGWGMIPVRVRVGGTSWRTSLFPHGETYVLPLRASVRRAEGVELGDTVEAQLTVLAR